MTTAAAPSPTVNNAFRLIIPYLRDIEFLLTDQDISEIMINSPTDVFFEKDGAVQRAEGVTVDPRKLQVALQNIARRLGDDISEDRPILDSRLPDGSRIAAILPPCSVQGITLTIRKFNTRSFTIADLIAIGTMTKQAAALLVEAIINRENILISGGTGTGKTTMLNILTDAIPDDRRLVVIEDTAEIHIRKPNVVRLEARKAQGDIPEIPIRDLVVASLRLRPDTTILGEIRKGEAFDFLQALNTGHSGSLSTIHSSTAHSSLPRLESCVLMSGVQMPFPAIKANIGTAINLLVHIERHHGKRFISEIVRLKGYSPVTDSYSLETLYSRTEDTTSPRTTSPAPEEK